jgi:hypothetical protein
VLTPIPFARSVEKRQWTILGLLIEPQSREDEQMATEFCITGRAVSWAQEHPEHDAIHCTRAGSVQRILERLGANSA